MPESTDSDKTQSDRALITRSQPGALLSPKELHALKKLEITRTDIQENLEEIGDYVKFLESVLKDKLTPTHDVQDLNRRLRKAKQEIDRFRTEIQAIEEYLDSYAHGRLPPNNTSDAESLESGS